MVVITAIILILLFNDYALQAVVKSSLKGLTLSLITVIYPNTHKKYKWIKV
jgi:hypothetical protein